MRNFEETKRLLEDSQIYYLISVNMDCNYSYVNKRYNRKFEQQYGDLVGQHYSITMHPEDIKICESVSEMAFRNPDKIFPATIRKHDGNGGYIMTRWEYKAIFNADNIPIGMFCIGHDITEFMQKSIELEETRKTLNKTKYTLSEIAYIQSHGVRKPLANIMGLSYLLESMEMAPEVKAIFNMINESAKELDRLIKNLNSKSESRSE